MDYNLDDEIPYTMSIVTQENHRRDGLTLLVTAINAIHDFNNRNSPLDRPYFWNDNNNDDDILLDCHPDISLSVTRLTGKHTKKFLGW